MHKKKKRNPKLVASQVVQWSEVCLPMQETQEIGIQPLGQEEMAATPVFLPQKFHGQRNLAGYSP